MGQQSTPPCPDTQKIEQDIRNRAMERQLLQLRICALLSTIGFLRMLQSSGPGQIDLDDVDATHEQGLANGVDVGFEPSDIRRLMGGIGTTIGEFEALLKYLEHKEEQQQPPQNN